MIETSLYTQKGEKSGTLKLPENLFGLQWNRELVHQVLESERANHRKKIAHVKMRGEVSGGGKKPWRQKGTGRARHGSTRSPIWRKGGVTHGPNAKVVYTKKINKKMHSKAIATVLSGKFRDNELVFIDSLNFTNHKTKQAIELLQAFHKVKEFQTLGEKGGRALVLLPTHDMNIARAVRNLQRLSVKPASMAEVLDLLSCKYIVLPKESIGVLEKKVGTRPVKKVRNTKK